MPMSFERLKPMTKEPGEKYVHPYHEDQLLMGMGVSENVEIMGSSLFHDQDISWFIVIDKKTGERIKVVLREHDWTIYEPKGKPIRLIEE